MNTTPSPSGRPPADPSLKHHPLCAALGAVMRRRRESRGLSQYALADRTKITRQTVENVEADLCAYSFTIIARMCDELDLAVSVAVTEAETDREEPSSIND